MDSPAANANAGDVDSMTVKRLLLLALMVGFFVGDVRADSGLLRSVQTDAGIRAVILTRPTPLRVGETVVEVLLREIATDAPLADADVRVIARNAAWSPGMGSIEVPAVLDPRDRTARHAPINFPASGRWDIVIHVSADGREAAFEFSVDVAEPFGSLWLIAPIALAGLPFALLIVLRDRLKTAR